MNVNVLISTFILVRDLQIIKFSLTLNFSATYLQRLWLCVYWKFDYVQKTFAW